MNLHGTCCSVFNGLIQLIKISARQVRYLLSCPVQLELYKEFIRVSYFVIFPNDSQVSYQR